MPNESLPSYWVAHEFPERPFAFGMWLCDCRACIAALRADATLRPGRPLVMKCGRDRFIVTAVDLLTAIESDEGAEGLLRFPDDYIREIFVADEPLPTRQKRRRNRAA